MKPANIGNLIERYSSGVSLGEIGRELGVKGDTVKRWMTGHGVKFRTKAEATRIAKTKKVPANFVKRYNSGESLNSLAKEYGISRGGIYKSGPKTGQSFGLLKKLIDAGISPRNQSASESIKWSRMTDAQRGNQVRSAHTAIPGNDEILIAAELGKLGVPVIHQHVVGKYNVDFSLHGFPIAVEIQRTWGSPSYRCYLRNRLEYILNRRHFVFYVSGKITDATSVSNQIVAFKDFISMNKPSICGYRMVSGDGKFCASSCSYFDKLPLI